MGEQGRGEQAKPRKRIAHLLFLFNLIYNSMMRDPFDPIVLKPLFPQVKRWKRHTQTLQEKHIFFKFLKSFNLVECHSIEIHQLQYLTVNENNCYILMMAFLWGQDYQEGEER